MYPLPPKIWMALEVCATAASAAKHLAMEAAAVASVPASSLCAAERTSRRAASVSFAMSASMNWMPWNSAIAWPNCLRILACSTDASSAACRMPTASDAMPTRPFSSTLIIMWKPLPCVPSRASAGNATFSKCSSPTCEERWPSLCSFVPRDTPADAQSTMKMLMPRLPASGSGRVLNPRLGPVRQPPLAVAHGGGLHPGNVGAGARLGDAVGRALGCGNERTNPLVLLRIGAVRAQQRGHQFDQTAPVGHACIAAAELFHDQRVGQQVEPGTAVLLRHGDAENPALSHRLIDVTGEGLLTIETLCMRTNLFVREAARHVCNLLMFCR